MLLPESSTGYDVFCKRIYTIAVAQQANVRASALMKNHFAYAVSQIVPQVKRHLYKISTAPRYISTVFMPAAV
jgi:hypothetical protein